jgi:hypothetical protein
MERIAIRNLLNPDAPINEKKEEEERDWPFYSKAKATKPWSSPSSPNEISSRPYMDQLKRISGMISVPTIDFCSWYAEKRPYFTMVFYWFT